MSERRGRREGEREGERGRRWGVVLIYKEKDRECVSEGRRDRERGKDEERQRGET